MSVRPACPLRAHVGRPVCPLARVPPARGDSPVAPAAARLRARPATTTSPDASPDLAMIEEKYMYRAQRPLSLRGSPVIAAGAGGQKARPGRQDHRIRALPRPRRAGSRDGHLPGRGAGTVPAYLAGALAGVHPARRGARGRPAICPRRQPARGQPGCSASARHGGPAIPVPRSPAYRQAARRGSGIGPGALTTARIPRVYLRCTSHGPGRETAGQRRI